VATSTTRLGLRKPDPTDTVSVSLDLNANADKLDAAIGATVCTSGARPGSPFQGQLIFETDTNRLLYYPGSLPWKYYHVPDKARIYKDNAATIAHNTSTFITWNQRDYDLSPGQIMWSSGTNPNRITPPVAGIWHIAYTAKLAQNGTDFRRVWLEMNAAGVPGGGTELKSTHTTAPANLSWAGGVEGDFAFNGTTDYFECGISQFSGVGLALTVAGGAKHHVHVTCRWVGPSS
jgi:hypothetical protein